MSSNPSSDQEDNNDKDFNIEDYRDAIDSDESFEEPPSQDPPKKDQIEIEPEQPQVENEYIGPILPGGHRFDRKFVAIKYPGNVINADRAVVTLGGLNDISTAINTTNRRLELTFRPDDVFCKPTCADKHKTNAFLLRVRVKKTRVQQAESTDKPTNKSIKTLVDQVKTCNINDTVGDSNEPGFDKGTNSQPTFDNQQYEDLSKDKSYELPKVKVLGRVDTEFRFTNLCDYQFLPLMQRLKNSKKLECIYSMIYPKDIPTPGWMKQDVPYFLPPAAFSRMDSVQQYVPRTEVDTLPENVIGKSRKSRKGFSNFIHFSTPEVPTEAPQGIETAMKVKFLQQIHLDQIREIFAQRPIWSKNALMCITKFSSDQLKILLPSVAYYFMNGPWRVMWVRLGYDPRKDISSRKYQTLDYRLKSMYGLSSTVKCKRNYAQYILPYRSVPTSKRKATYFNSSMKQDRNKKKETEFNEDSYIYKEGCVPPSRQMFYQYCDIHVDEIQEMLAKLPDLPGNKCHEKGGWLPNGFDELCREIINKQVRVVLRQKLNITEDRPLKRKTTGNTSNSKMKDKLKKRVKPDESLDNKNTTSPSTSQKTD